MNINVDMGEILTKAWKITWKFKVLWIFGILAGCGSNNGGNFNNNFSNGGGSGSGRDGEVPEFFRQFENMQPEQAIRSFMNEYSQYLAIIAVVVVLLCILSLVFYALGIIGKIGLVKGTAKGDAGAEKLTFGELWTESLPYFWRMVGLSLLIGLPFFIILVILLIVFFAGIFSFAAVENPNSGSVAGLLAALGIFVPAICCLSIASIVVRMIVEQAQNAIIMEDKGVLAGLSRGWDVFKRNILTIVLLAIILSVLGGIVGFVVAIPIVLAVIPAVAGAALMAVPDPAVTSAAWVPLIIAGLCCLAYFPVLLVFSGIQQTYIQAAWTLTYLRLTAPTPAAPAAAPEIADAQ
jgi:hypothetical protein